MVTVNRLVLDLSHHNTVSSWVDVKLAGIVGIIHKATEGSSVVDPNYVAAKKSARNTGLLWGAYHFMRPGNMIGQAEFFVNKADVGPEDILVADHEDDKVSLDDLKVFLGEVFRLTNRRPVLYSGNVIKEQVGTGKDSFLSQHKLWIAQYSSLGPKWPMQIWSEYWLWQYSDGNFGPEPQGCPGVSGEVDTNSAPDKDSLVRSWRGVEGPVVGPSVVEITIKAPLGVSVVVKQV